MTDWVRVRAPVRVLDAGGWTDTWFAHRGTVCHVAVDDGAEVWARRTGPAPAGTAPAVELWVPAFGDRYRYALDAAPGRHPLLEAAVRRWAPPGTGVEAAIGSSVPPGSGLGTSACVLVALIAALKVLRGTVIEPADLARAAHDVETADAGMQSGVQDQVAAAHGGCNLVDVDPYPQLRVHPLELADSTRDALDHRMTTVYLGAPHRSSVVHDAVIARLTHADPEPLLAPLRAAAVRAAGALAAGDLDAYGAAMTANTEAQAALHPDLVNPLARTVIDVARRHGAAGWKVNGAGGPGGTVTVIGPAEPAALTAALGRLPGATVLPLRTAPHGVRVVDAG